MQPIEIQNVTKDFGQGKGVFDISFSVKEGEVFGYLGPNGAGKSTIFKMLTEEIKPDGIISTKQTLIKCAAAKGLLTVQRFFLIDSLAFSNLVKQIKNTSLDIIEVLPACSTKIISKIVNLTDVPVIASGLIQDKEDIMAALNVGAIAVSGTNFDLF